MRGKRELGGRERQREQKTKATGLCLVVLQLQPVVGHQTDMFHTGLVHTDLGPILEQDGDAVLPLPATWGEHKQNKESKETKRK